MALTKIVCGDALQTLKRILPDSINCVVTSPPYFGLRDYGVEGQVGLEQSPQDYVQKLVEIFREVRRVLRPDGTCWLNLGDSYTRAPSKGGSVPNGKNEERWGYGEANKQRVKDPNSKQATNRSADIDGVPRNATVGYSDGAAGRAAWPGSRAAIDGLASKQLLGIPWRVAFALQDDGWYLRQDIIWHKPNPMPESVRDRCTKAHEYLFMLTKSAKYFYNADAIKEPSIYAPGKTKEVEREKGYYGGHAGFNERWKSERNDGSFKAIRETRNKRSVWTIAPKPYKEAHFATFPSALVEPCILAGCPENGVVLDPFGGAGTTGLVAKSLNRHCVLIELNPEYVKLIEQRLAC